MTTALSGADRTSDAAERRRWLVLGLVLLAQFMVTLDATIVTVALPTIQTGLHFQSQLSLEWVINAYILLFGGFLLLGGRAGDLYGRQRMFIAGLVLFTGASLVNGLAQSPEMLIIGRGAQGVGAALVSPSVLSIIIITFHNAHERTKALTFYSALTAAGSAAGILAGGVLTSYVSWRAIFLVNVPIGAIALLGALRLIANGKTRPGGIRTMDLPGAITVTAGLTLFVYAVVNADSWGWGSQRVLWLIVAAAVLLIAFVAIEKRTRDPLIRLGIFASRSLTASNVAMFLMLAGLYLTMFFPTLYLAQLKHDSPIRIGLAYLPWPVAMAFSASLAQPLIKRLGFKVPLITGLVILPVGLILLANLKLTSSYAAGVLPGMVLTALGAGLAWGTLFLVASSGVAAQESGLAAGIINTSYQLGAAVGLAVFGSIAAAHTTGLLSHIVGPTQHQQDIALVAGFGRGFFIGGIVAAVAALVALVFLHNKDIHQPTATIPEPAASSQPENVTGSLGAHAV